MSQTIAIIGAGAVGGFLAANLIKQNYSVCFVDARLQQSKTISIDYQGLDQNKQQLQLECYPQIPNNCDLIVVCLKAYQIGEALSQLALPSKSPLLLLNNGYGVHLELQAKYPQQVLLLGSNSHGARLQQKRQQSLKLRHSGPGQIAIGGLYPEQDMPEIVTQLSQRCPDLHVFIQANIFPSLWLKLAINCCINPITALHDCRNGQLLQQGFHPILKVLCQEFCTVAALAGQDFKPEFVFEQVLAVATKTASNFSSMQQDLSQQRTTEIAYINGYLLQLAKQHQLNLPMNQAIVEQVTALEAANAAPQIA